MKSRFCARDFNKREKRDDLFAPGSTKDTGRLIDFTAVKNDLVTFTVDITAAYNTLFELETVYLKPPKEWMEIRAEKGHDHECYSGKRVQVFCTLGKTTRNLVKNMKTC